MAAELMRCGRSALLRSCSWWMGEWWKWVQVKSSIHPPRSSVSGASRTPRSPSGQPSEFGPTGRRPSCKHASISVSNVPSAGGQRMPDGSLQVSLKIALPPQTSRMMACMHARQIRPEASGPGHRPAAPRSCTPMDADLSGACIPDRIRLLPRRPLMRQSVHCYCWRCSSQSPSIATLRPRATSTLPFIVRGTMGWGHASGLRLILVPNSFRQPDPRTVDPLITPGDCPVCVSLSVSAPDPVDHCLVLARVALSASCAEAHILRKLKKGSQARMSFFAQRRSSLYLVIFRALARSTRPFEVHNKTTWNEKT